MTLAYKTPPQQPDLYETDYYAWLVENAALIRAGRVGEADLANIAEELEDTGRSEKRAIGSHIQVLLLHLLKWRFQPGNRGSSWRGSIYNARSSIKDLLGESPSLRPKLPGFLDDRYPMARFNAANETGLGESTFPETCPFTVEQVRNDGFWPDEAP